MSQFPTLLSIVALTASPMAVHAETAPTPPRVEHASGSAEAKAAQDQRYGPITLPAHDDFTKTVVDYGFAPRGLMASVGYVCVPDGHPLDSPGADTDGSSRFGRQDELVGAALNYAFK